MRTKSHPLILFITITFIIAFSTYSGASSADSNSPASSENHFSEITEKKYLGALKLVDEMEREFKIVAELDPHFDFAGADRNLGMLYHETPGWPVSIGNRKKARQHLERSRELAPDFPENHLYLLEAYLKWN